MISVAFSNNERAIASADIHQKEDEAMYNSIENKMAALSIRKQNYPPRPEYVSGPTIRLRTNYFQIRFNPKAQLFRYLVSVGNLSDKQKRKMPRIIKLLLEDPFFSTVRPSPATDFSGSIVTTTELQLERKLVDEKTQEFKYFRIFNVHYRVRFLRLKFLQTTPLV